MSRHFWILIFVLIPSLILLVAWLQSRAPSPRPPRPLFHNDFIPMEMGPRSWFPDYPLDDDYGTLIYYDKRLNLLAVLATGNPRTPWPQPFGDSEKVTLGHETPCEIEVGKSSNQIILVFPHSAAPLKFPITQTQGATLYRKLEGIRSKQAPRHFDALAVIKEHGGLSKDTNSQIESMATASK